MQEIGIQNLIISILISWKLNILNSVPLKLFFWSDQIVQLKILIVVIFFLFVYYYWKCQKYIILPPRNEWPNKFDSLDIPQEVEDEFERIAHYCIAYQMCAKIGTIQPEDYDILTNPDDFGPISVYNKERKTDQFSTLNYTIDETKNNVELQVGY